VDAFVTEPPSKRDAGGLAGLMAPSRVAVIGASESPGNRGGQAISYLRKFGFAGAVTPVHPAGHSVHGYAGVTSLDDLDGTPDVALVAVGARNVTPVIADLGRHGIRAAIVWAGGFAEGGADGARLQRELAATARSAGVRVLGPNCLGLVNTTARFFGTFASWLKSVDDVIPGRISMVTQSGGLGAAAHAAAQEYGVGFRCMASTGNEADVTAVEMLELFADDPETRVIATYLEGAAQGRRLAAAMARAKANGKDVVFLKGGRSAASARAVAAHTGALAGQARVWESVLAAVGAVQAYSLEELIEVSVALDAASGKPPAAGRRVGIVSYGGGSGVLAADQCTEAGLEVPALSEPLRAELSELAPPIASLRNPIDLTPEAFNQERYRNSYLDLLRTVMNSDEVDAVLLQGGAMAYGAEEAAQAMCAFAKDSSKQLAIYWPAAPEPARAPSSSSAPSATRTLARWSR
jgi:acetate---CoA ligase (ADP-forming)